MIPRLSILLPVIDETFSLEKTVELIIKENKIYVYEIIIIISREKTHKNSKIVIDKLKEKYSHLIKVFYQDIKFLGGAIRKGFEKSQGTHVLMMASDLETNPLDVKKMIALCCNHSSSIITANRWFIKGGGFKNYNFLKLLLNFIFQNMLKLIYLTKLSDMTFGFRLFPIEIIRKIKWEEIRHPFLLETIIKPLRLGTDVIEFPSKWEIRQEGSSNNSFINNFAYFGILIKVRFMKKENILKNE